MPTMPDFYGMLVRQCTITTRGTASLVEFLLSGDPGVGKQVRPGAGIGFLKRLDIHVERTDALQCFVSTPGGDLT